MTATVVCLVGSAKQESDFRKASDALTRVGYVVLELGLYGAEGKNITKEEFDRVTITHRQKIRMSDCLGIIPKDPAGTVGRNTLDDIRYGLKLKKPVFFVSELSGNPIWTDHETFVSAARMTAYARKA